MWEEEAKVEIVRMQEVPEMERETEGRVIETILRVHFCTYMSEMFRFKHLPMW